MYVHQIFVYNLILNPIQLTAIIYGDNINFTYIITNQV